MCSNVFLFSLFYRPSYNIPELDTINIMTNILNSNSEIEGNKQKKIMYILKTVTEQLF